MKTPYVPQLADTDCAPAALTAILGGFGRHVRISEIATACETGRDGTSAAALARAAEKYGLSCKAHRLLPGADLGAALRAVDLPAILLLQNHHFVVAEDVEGDRIRVNDPATGRYQTDNAELTARCAGLVLSLRPTADFEPGGRVDAGVVRRWWQQECLREQLLACFAIVAAVTAAVIALGSLVVVRSAGLSMTETAGHLAVVLSALAVAGLVFGWSGAHARSRLHHHTATRRAAELVDRLLRLPVPFLSRRFSGEVAMRPQQVDSAAMTMVALLVDGSVATITLALALVGLAQASIWAAMLVLLAGVADTLLLREGRGRYAEATRATIAEQQRRDTEVLGSLRSLEVLKSEASPDQIVRRWASAQDKVDDHERRAHLMMARRTRATMLLDAVATVLVLVIVHTTTLLPAQIMIAALFTSVALGANRQLGSLSSFSRTQVQATMRLVDDVMLEPLPDAVRPAGPDPQELRVRGLAYAHSTSARPLFRGVDLHLPAGGGAFVVGDSGVGKSTLLKVLVGVLPATAGQVLRPEQTTYVPQRPLLMEGTVADNVLLGAEADDATLAWALRTAAIDQVVEARGGPHVAVLTQGGGNFSGGERARLALARALVRRPRLLLLDEAFAAVEDSLAQELYRRLCATGISFLCVAHQLPTLAPTDSVWRLTPGGLIAQPIATLTAHNPAERAS